jgi:putative tRNA adenosine deaminase-associated protein
MVRDVQAHGAQPTALVHHVRVPFFTAVMASDGNAWRARDIDVEDAADLDDLASTLRAAAHKDHPVLAVIEAEDQWFALVRVDDDDGARIFVSDLTSASAGHYGPVVSAAADVDIDLPVGADDEEVAEGSEVETDADETVPAAAAGDSDPDSGAVATVDDVVAENASGADEDADDDEDIDIELIATPSEEEPHVRTWAGDPTLLEDFGVDARTLIEMVEENPDDPSTVLADLGEQVGFGDLIEALR